MITNNQKAFLDLVRAGLWEKGNVNLDLHLTFDGVDWMKVYDMAEEQGVTGLIATGIDRLNVDVPLDFKLQFVGSALQTEQTNKEMNAFIADIVARMREKGIHTLLVKGQGIAQCYDKPLWRPSGDVDFLLDKENYRKADDYLSPTATYRKFGGRYSKEIILDIDAWTVELHGSLRTGLSANVDRVVDEVHGDTFANKKVRVWQDGDTDVMLPSPNEDVFFVFTHFIKHFYKEGMSLRQVCDWCRLLWAYKDSLNYEILESRIRKAGLMSEWRGFAVMAVKYLGMPVEAMPFCDVRCKKDDVRAKKLIKLILGGYSGNKYKDTLRIAMIYPWNTLKFLPGILWHVNWLKIKERIVIK